MSPDRINADFTARAAVHSATLPWTPSPIPGVDRRMLDRVGAEVARATTIVRYAPGSHFAPHTHGGGEEFLVLEGTFQDEHGDFPAGTYVRNPPTSRHRPGSAAGCTIFVKLWQMDPTDRTQLCLDTSGPYAPARPGVDRLPLFEAADEVVSMERWGPGAGIVWTPAGGLELLVIEGTFTLGAEVFGQLAWLRLPDGAALAATAGLAGCTVWMKSGHLREPVPRPPG